MTRTPFNFSRAIFLPFQHGEGSAGFTLKSALFYALVLTLTYAAFGGAFMGSFTEIMEAALEIETAPTPDQEAAMALQMLSSMGRMMLLFLPLLLITWIVWAMIEAEFHRRVLRPEDAHAGVFPWRFGKEELRVMLCQFLVWVAGIVLFFIFYTVAALIIVAAVMGGSQSTAIGIIAGLLAAAAVIAGFLFFGFVLIRLAPSAAFSVAKEEIAIGEAWGITKGRFWPALGAYAFQWIIGYTVVYVISLVIMSALLGAAFAGMASGFGGSDEEAIRQMIDMFTSPGAITGMLIATFLTSIINAIWFLCVAGIGTHLVWLNREDTGLTAAEVFS